MQMIRAADVTVPTEIQTVAVIDRSGAANVGQGILGVLEGALTGEAIGADTQGRREAVRGLREMLATSERYEVVMPVGIDREQSLFDRELSWTAAAHICRSAPCDAIIALEAFDSDTSDDVRSRQVERTDSNGGKYRVTEFTVERRTRVLTAWRIYHPSTRHVVDDLRDRSDSFSWRERGDSREQARSRLPSQSDTVRTSAYRAGQLYGRRIAPTPFWVARPYYGKTAGNDTLRLAKQNMKARDYEGAITTYASLTDHPDPKVRGRAAFNTAVAEEALGRLERSLTAARTAAVEMGNGRTRSYVMSIEGRIRQRDRVQEQLAPPPEPAVPVSPGDGAMTR